MSERKEINSWIVNSFEGNSSKCIHAIFEYNLLTTGQIPPPATPYLAAPLPFFEDSDGRSVRDRDLIESDET